MRSLMFLGQVGNFLFCFKRQSTVEAGGIIFVTVHLHYWGLAPLIPAGESVWFFLYFAFIGYHHIEIRPPFTLASNCF